MCPIDTLLHTIGVILQFSIFTNEEITVVHSLARGLEECEPLSDHVDQLSLSVMSKAIKNSNYKFAKDAIKSGAKEGTKSITLLNLSSALKIDFRAL